MNHFGLLKIVLFSQGEIHYLGNLSGICVFGLGKYHVWKAIYIYIYNKKIL